jgi:hypothetical protein
LAAAAVTAASSLSAAELADDAPPQAHRRTEAPSAASDIPARIVIEPPVG